MIRKAVAYTDYGGWDTTPFVSAGEFAPEFGDYDVSLDIPRGMLVAGSGTLTNGKDVLTADQLARLDRANNGERQQVVSVSEAARVPKFGGRATWRFSGRNIRDFAFAASRRYAWEAQRPNKNAPVAMAYYTPEAAPLWQRFALPAISHTLDVYGSRTFPYPYPVIQAAYGPIDGMEHSMLAFSRYAPDGPDGSYSAQMKRDFLWVLIHEVGHAWFPLVVNSNERQWTWMDEGLNTFLEYIAELEWEEKFPAFGDKTNVLDAITTYMQSSDQVPIMTNSESIVQFGPNAYSKPAAALSVLREVVMGRELFDHAFREYSNRWKFKRPTPADFFRTMEDASGVDLDWFWRGWFYGTDHVDVAVGDIREYQVSSQDPEVEFPLKRAEFARDWPDSYSQKLNKAEGRTTRLERYPELKDFYNENDAFVVTNKDRNEYRDFLEKLKPWEKATFERAVKAGEYVYFVDFQNIGGLVTPLPLTINYVDGSREDYLVPAEVWRYNAIEVTKLFIRDKRIASVELDRNHLIADADKSNNITPRRIAQSRIELFRARDSGRNQMLDALAELKTKGKSGDEAKTEEKALPLAPAQP